MEVKFENITKYNKKVYEDFLKFHTKKYFTNYVIYTIAIAVILIYMLICTISYKNLNLIFILTFCLISFIIYRVYSQKIIIEKEMNSSKIIEQEEFSFKFYDKKITINGEKQVEKINYKNICKAFETKKYFYLYIDKTHAFILDKKGFVNKDYNEFRKFLKTKLRRKFKYLETI